LLNRPGPRRRRAVRSIGDRAAMDRSTSTTSAPITVDRLLAEARGALRRRRARRCAAPASTSACTAPTDDGRRPEWDPSAGQQSDAGGGGELKRCRVWSGTSYHRPLLAGHLGSGDGAADAATVVAAVDGIVRRAERSTRRRAIASADERRRAMPTSSAGRCARAYTPNEVLTGHGGPDVVRPSRGPVRP
jgi:hypothetical protein